MSSGFLSARLSHSPIHAQEWAEMDLGIFLNYSFYLTPSRGMQDLSSPTGD